MVNSSVDLSSFPLLRIDEVYRHSIETLVDAEQRLTELKQNEEAIASIAPFVSKLLVRIQEELNQRRGIETLGSSSVPTGKITSTDPRSVASTRSFKSSPKKRTTSSSTAQRNHKQQPQTISFFVPSSPESKASSFRSRSKHATASLKARTPTKAALTEQNEQQRAERTQKALETMQEWRKKREQSKQRRENLMEEERRYLRLRRREKRQREERIKNSMQVAAEEAKSLALISGLSQEEAVLEAAAAAARVVDDESTLFHESCGGNSDTGSLTDDDTGSSGDSTQHEAPSRTNAEPSELTCVGTSVDNETSEHSPKSMKNVDARDKISSFAPYEPSKEPCNIKLQIADAKGINQQEEVGAYYGAINGSKDKTVPNIFYAATHVDELSENCAQEVEKPAFDRTDEDSSCTENTTLAPQMTDDSVNIQPSPTIPKSPETVKEQNNKSCTKELYDTSFHVDEEEHTPTQPRTKPDRFASSFPSFSHIFAQFTTGITSKSDARRELLKCMQTQIERCSNTEMSVDPCNSAYDDDPASLFHIKSNREEIVEIIRKSLSDRQMSRWEEVSDDTLWNLMWTWGMPKAADFDHLLVFQKISRFRSTRGLTRKDLLKKNIQRCVGTAARTLRDVFNIMPLTYALPHEFNAFVKGFNLMNAAESKRCNFWILKPIGLSRGRGISLVDSILDVSYSQPIVIQKYIDDPLCFMGYKFDLRIYVLVTSFSPLEAFIYQEGLARFGSRQYSSNPQTIHDLRIHLTNSSIQKEFEEAIDKSHPAYFAGANGAESKVAMSWLWKRLDDIGIDSKVLWNRIVDTCIQALVAGGSDIPHQPNSFELFGFDLMFDQNLKCWLIEVNSSPSLSCSTPLDTRIKGNLIRDTIALVSPSRIDRKALSDICTRRLSRRKDASNLSSSEILEQDLRQILRDGFPRAYGEMPVTLGRYERIAPGTRTYNKLIS